MSNKTLVAVIIILLVIVGGGLAWYYSSNRSAVKGTQDQSTTAGSMNMQDTNTASAASATSSQTTNQGQTMNGCTRDFDSAKLTQNANINIANRQVTINVQNFGPITVELFDKDAPKTVENFLRLTDAGYYDCLTFHRVSKGFVIQGGDPNGDGSGGQSAYGAPFADEINPKLDIYQMPDPNNPGKTIPGYAKGILAMANSGPNTNGSQFFIMLSDVPTQPGGFEPNYTIFGKVITGLDTVDKIGSVDITPNPMMGPNDGAPKVPVVMESVKITK